MRKRSIINIDNSKIIWGINYILQYGEIYGIEIRFKLDDRLKERGMTLRDLNEICGLRLATISDIINGNKSTINFQHLIAIMIVLRITDITEIFEIHFPDYLVDLYKHETREWIQRNEKPSELFAFKLAQTFTPEQQEENDRNMDVQIEELRKRAMTMKKEFELKNKGSH